MLLSLVQRISRTLGRRSFGSGGNTAKKRERMSRVLVQKLNVLTGNQEWRIEDENYDFHQEIARSAFADMLHDTDRNQKYYKALKKAIKDRHDAGEEAHVLDIGTGTGLLSMMAAASGADSIVACECFQPIASIAREVIALNGFEGKIKVVGKRSTELVVGKDLERKANILVTEVFDTELIGEGAVETFNHAHRHLLQEDATVIPHTGRMYAVVVESQLLSDHNRLRERWEVKSGLEPIRLPPDIVECEGSPSLHDIQVSQLPPQSFKTLTQPLEIFRFDFSRGYLKYEETSSRELKVVEPGRADCAVIWWELDMVADAGGQDKDEDVISCAPRWLDGCAATPWRDHWMQAVYHLVPQRCQISTRGPAPHLVSYHDEYSLWFRLGDDGESETNRKAPVCNCGYHATNSRSRTAAVNDLKLWNNYVNSLANSIDPESVLFFCGDTSLIPLAAARLNPRKVYCVEENTVAFRVMERIIKHNGLEDKVVLLPKYDKKLIQEKVTHVMSEPYLRAAIYPWEELRIWYLTRAMFREDDPRLIPGKASIWALPVQFEHLHKIRAPLATVEGFNLSPFDKLIKMSSDISDAAVEVHPLWEYPCKALSRQVRLIEFDLKGPLPEEDTVRQKGRIPFESEGVCNGIALWMEWEMSEGWTIGRGPRADAEIVPGERVPWQIYYRQPVYFFYKQNNRVSPSEDEIDYSVTFEPSQASCSFGFEFVK